MPEPDQATGESQAGAVLAVATLREVVALIDAGELTATATQRGFLMGAIAAQDSNPLLYK